MIPFAILSGKIKTKTDEKEIRLLELSPDYFTFRLLKEQAKKQVSEKKGITISTLHSIKGLEFDAVFLMDVNEGSLPYHKAVTESSIEEERRLFYVGITRARKFLWILYAKNRHDKELEVSRFLTESGLVLKEEKDKKK